MVAKGGKRWCSVKMAAESWHWEKAEDVTIQPGTRNGNPLQYFCLRNPIDRGAWAGYSPEGCKESDMPEHACPVVI